MGAAKRVELFVTKNPASAIWELPSPSEAGDYLLIGWRVSPEPVDGGMPPTVADLLTKALCDCATVSFLSDDSRTPSFTTVPTSDPAVAFALLSAKDARPPDLTSKQVSALIEHRDPGIAKQAGFAGVLLPGVDGDVAGLWVFDPEAERRLILIDLMQALVSRCKAAGYSLTTTTEEEFRESLRHPDA